MEISALSSPSQSQDITQLVQDVNRVQIEMMKKMLQAQAEMMVAAQKAQTAEQVQASVDYYA